MARLPAVQLTDKQAEFVRHLALGVPKVRAADLAGYSGADTEPSRLLRLPHVLAALDLETSRLMNSELAPLAMGRLRQLLMNPETAGTTLVHAIKLGLAHVGKGTTLDKLDGRSMSEMTVSELEDRLSRLDEALRIHDAKVIDNVPDSTVTDVPSDEDVFG